jgi:SAM-dependent methyltransferase
VIEREEATMTTTSQANQEQREFWSGAGGCEWLRHNDWWERMFAPFGEAMLQAAALRGGDRVLDVGCGAGTSTVAAARAVAPDGAVVGVDISPQMLDVARERAPELGNVTWLEADAQLHQFQPAGYDAVISRFAVMLFDDPMAAFTNLHSCLRPGGRMAFVCWQAPTACEWISVALSVAVPAVGRYPDLGEPGAPGPFAFADGERLRGLVAAGGFGDVTVEAVTRPQRLGADPYEAVAAVMALPETRDLLAGSPDGAYAEVAAALTEAFTPYAGPEGVVMDSTAWLVSARA